MYNHPFSNFRRAIAAWGSRTWNHANKHKQTGLTDREFDMQTSSWAYPTNDCSKLYVTAIIWVPNNVTFNTKRFVPSSNSKRALLPFKTGFLLPSIHSAPPFFTLDHIYWLHLPWNWSVLGQATTESYHSVHSHRSLDSSYSNICSSQKALRATCRRFRDLRKRLERDSA